MAVVSAVGSCDVRTIQLSGITLIGKLRQSIGNLARRRIHHWLIGICQAVFAQVTDNADNLPGGLLYFGPQTLADGDAMANGVFFSANTSWPTPG